MRVARIGWLSLGEATCCAAMPKRRAEMQKHRHQSWRVQPPEDDGTGGLKPCLSRWCCSLNYCFNKAIPPPTGALRPNGFLKATSVAYMAALLTVNSGTPTRAAYIANCQGEASMVCRRPSMPGIDFTPNPVSASCLALAVRNSAMWIRQLLKPRSGGIVREPAPTSANRIPPS